MTQSCEGHWPCSSGKVCEVAMTAGSAMVWVLCELPNAAQPASTAAATAVSASVPARRASSRDRVGVGAWEERA
ncbi:hypothetical protein D3C72_1679140 [compost metagenome]